MKIKDNKCKITFKCFDVKKDCVYFKGNDLNECKYEKEYSISIGDNKYECKSKIAQVNKAIIFLKDNIGDENLKKYIANELKIKL